jgi:hypothetical protein
MSDNEKRIKLKYEAPTVGALGGPLQATGDNCTSVGSNASPGYCTAGINATGAPGYCSAGTNATPGYCSNGTSVATYCSSGDGH